MAVTAWAPEAAPDSEIWLREALAGWGDGGSAAGAEPHGDDAFEGEVVGTDDRTRVADSLAAPYRWVCSVSVQPAASGPTPAASFGRGTGVLVGPRHVLTSAHVLLDENDNRTRDPAQIEISPARNGLGAKGNLLGTFTTRKYVVHPLWQAENTNQLHAFQQRVQRAFFRAHPSFDPGAFQRLVAVFRNTFDYGLVILEDDLSALEHESFGARAGRKGALGHWNATATARFDRLGPGVLGGAAARVVGYPGARQRRRRGWDMFEGDGQIEALHTWSRVLAHTADTSEGNSGGPVWIDHDGRTWLVGIHRGAGARGDRRNHAIRVTRELKRTVDRWIASN